MGWAITVAQAIGKASGLISVRSVDMTSVIIVTDSQQLIPVLACNEIAKSNLFSR